MTVSSEGKFSTVDDKARAYAKWGNTMCVMVMVVLGTAGGEGLEENRAL